MQEYFNEIADKRHQSYVKHRLQDILVMLMCAVLCGLDELSAVMVYIQNKADFFAQNFGIQEIPSKPTVSRVLRMIDGKQVAQIILGNLFFFMKRPCFFIFGNGNSCRDMLL